MSSALVADPRRGRWIPWLIVGFFLLLAALFASFATVAVRSYPGVTTTEAYEKGLAYNETLAEAEASAKLGWKVDLETEATGPLQVALSVRISGAEGQIPAQNMKAAVYLARPTLAGYDFSMPLQAEGDRFMATIHFPLAGNWVLRVVAGADGKEVQTTRRINVQ